MDDTENTTESNPDPRLLQPEILGLELLVREMASGVNRLSLEFDLPYITGDLDRVQDKLEEIRFILIGMKIKLQVAK